MKSHNAINRRYRRPLPDSLRNKDIVMMKPINQMTTEEIDDLKAMVEDFEDCGMGEEFMQALAQWEELTGEHGVNWAEAGE